MCECTSASVPRNMEMLVLKEWKRSYSLGTRVWLRPQLFSLPGGPVLERGASHPFPLPQLLPCLGG